MRCLKSRYLSDFKLADMSGNAVSEQADYLLKPISESALRASEISSYAITRSL